MIHYTTNNTDHNNHIDSIKYDRGFSLRRWSTLQSLSFTLSVVVAVVRPISLLTLWISEGLTQAQS